MADGVLHRLGQAPRDHGLITGHGLAQRAGRVHRQQQLGIAFAQQAGTRDLGQPGNRRLELLFHGQQPVEAFAALQQGGTQVAAQAGFPGRAQQRAKHRAPVQHHGVQQLGGDAILRGPLDPLRGDAWNEAVESLVLLLAPMTPHLSEELWERLGHSESVHRQPWPQWDEELARPATIEMPVQINGKVRAKMTVAADIDRAAAESAALQQPNAQRFIEGKTVRKVIVVPGKLVNIVAS